MPLEDLISSIFELSNNNDFRIGVATAIVTSIASVIIGIAAYIIKRVFIKKDFENQQKIEHSSWLLKKSHSFAEKYYVLLTRHLYDFDDNIRHAILSKNESTIKDTYDHLTEFLKKYNEFEKETGGNFLFIERSNEMEAIRKMQSFFFGLPFDSTDLKSIIENNSTRSFDSFTNWIKSDNCSKSKNLVKERVSELWPLLDDESEKIMHYDYFLKFNKKRKIKKIKKTFKHIFQKQGNIQTNNSFYIHKVEPKYAKAGEKVLVFGNGFKTENIHYDLKIKNFKMDKIIIDNTIVEGTIPNNISKGTYEIIADFKINDVVGDEPMGLVIHVS